MQQNTHSFGIFTKIENIWGHKTSLDKLKMIQVRYLTTVEINYVINRKVSVKLPNIWKFNNTSKQPVKQRRN